MNNMVLWKYCGRLRKNYIVHVLTVTFSLPNIIYTLVIKTYKQTKSKQAKRQVPILMRHSTSVKSRTAITPRKVEAGKITVGSEEVDLS